MGRDFLFAPMSLLFHNSTVTSDYCPYAFVFNPISLQIANFYFYFSLSLSFHRFVRWNWTRTRLSRHRAAIQRKLDRRWRSVSAPPPNASRRATLPKPFASTPTPSNASPTVMCCTAIARWPIVGRASSRRRCRTPSRPERSTQTGTRPTTDKASRYR